MFVTKFQFFSQETDEQAIANTSDLNEELGQVSEEQVIKYPPICRRS